MIGLIFLLFIIGSFSYFLYEYIWLKYIGKYIRKDIEKKFKARLNKSHYDSFIGE